MATEMGTRVVVSFPGSLDDVVWVHVYAVPVVDGVMDDDDGYEEAVWCQDSGRWSLVWGDPDVVVTDMQLDEIVESVAAMAELYQ